MVVRWGYFAAIDQWLRKYVCRRVDLESMVHGDDECGDVDDFGRDFEMQILGDACDLGFEYVEAASLGPHGVDDLEH